MDGSSSVPAFGDRSATPLSVSRNNVDIEDLPLREVPDLEESSEKAQSQLASERSSENEPEKIVEPRRPVTSHVMDERFSWM